MTRANFVEPSGIEKTTARNSGEPKKTGFWNGEISRILQQLQNKQAAAAVLRAESHRLLKEQSALCVRAAQEQATLRQVFPAGGSAHDLFRPYPDL